MLVPVLIFCRFVAAAEQWRPLQIPDVPVVDQNGKALRFYTDLVRGETVAINFIFTTCRTICTPLTANFRKLQKSLGDEPMKLISISVDPETDKPSVLRNFAASYGAAPGWTFVTGTAQDIETLLKALEAFTGDKTAHTSATLIGNDAARHWTRASGLSPADSLKALLFEAASFPTAGQLLYRQGRALHPVTARLRASDVELPSTQFACANCHGHRAEGRLEAGVSVPSLRWDVLAAKGYTPFTFSRAVTAGLAPSGAELHPAMPSYRLSPEDMAGLIAHLQDSSRSKADPGITDSRVRVAAALPLSGPLAPIGASIRHALEAVFEEANATGIYGRRIELVTADSGGVGGPLQASLSLLNDRVFAFVGSMIAPPIEGLETLLDDADATLIGPIGATPASGAGPVYYLLPSFEAQSLALADYLQQTKTASVAAVYSSTTLFAAFKAQLDRHGVAVAVDVPFRSGALDAAATVASLSAAKPGAIFFYGTEKDFGQLARVLDKSGLQVRLATLSVCAGRTAFELPPSITRALVLAHASPLPDMPGFAHLASLLAARGGITDPQAQAIAAASAHVFVEGLKRCGRDCSRLGLREALESFRGVETGLTPPITFGPGRTRGSSGAWIVRVDPGARHYTTTGWVTPVE